MPGIIFDFDDTLVHTTDRFDRIRRQFCGLLRDWGYDLPGIEHIVDGFDIRNIKQSGYFAAHCFPWALLQTYKHCCRVFNHPICPVKSDQIEEMGWSVFREPPLPCATAHDLLHELRASYPLVLLTKGDYEVQKKRIEQSGLAHYFCETFIVPNKDSTAFQKISEYLGIAPARSWAIGNSVKSDINPALRAGFRAVLVKANNWIYEDAEAIGTYYQVDILNEVREIILNPLSFPKIIEHES